MKLVNIFLIIITMLTGGITLSSASLAATLTLTAGLEHSVVLREDGSIHSWGKNHSGQLGDGTTLDRKTPKKIKNLSAITTITAGGYHTLALHRDGTVWAWGNNRMGQIGDGSTENRTTPVQVIGLSNIIAINAGIYHSLALDKNGTVWTWGDNSKGQLGNGSYDNSAMPSALPQLSNVTQIKSGYWHSYALKSDRSSVIWGYNPHGTLLSEAITISSPTPFPGKWDEALTHQQKAIEVTPPGEKEPVLIAAGSEHSIMMRLDGTVLERGANIESRQDTTEHATTPQLISMGIQRVEFSDTEDEITPPLQELAINEMVIELQAEEIENNGENKEDDQSPLFISSQNNVYVNTTQLPSTPETTSMVDYVPTTDVIINDDTTPPSTPESTSDTLKISSLDITQIDAAPIELNTVTHSYSEISSPPNYHLFKAEAGRKYVISVNGMENTEFALYNNQGTPVFSSKNHTRRLWIAPDSGSYIIKSGLDENWKSGSYNLSVNLQATKNDFNGDGKTDLLRRQNTTGRVAINYMNNKDFSSGGQTSKQAGQVGIWDLSGTGDFNGDGQIDLLWRGPTGKTYIWAMNGARMIDGSGATSAYVSQESAWKIATTGDFDGDGKTDIAWRHNLSGKLVIWFMDGLSVRENSGFISAQVDLISGWYIAGVGDFNSDGRSDFLWRHQSGGFTAIWFMSGLNVLNSSGLTSSYVSTASGWQIKGLGDFDANGYSDILWRQQNTGKTFIWFMQQLDIIEKSHFTQTQIEAEEPWEIADIGDYDGNGRSDILWKHNLNNNLLIWSMNELFSSSEKMMMNDMNNSWNIKN